MSPARLFRKIVCTSAIALPLATAVPANGQDLPRRTALGARVAEVEHGVRIDAVLPGGTAEALRLKAGDVITRFDGADVRALPAFLTKLYALPPGRSISMSLVRDGKPTNVTGRTLARSKEAYAGARVTYGTVPFRGGLLRDILVVPGSVERPPVVFYLQGFTCASIEAAAPDSLYAHLSADFAAAGIAFYRVEKPGVGDSAGGIDCRQIGFADELDGFRAAYRHLVDDLGYEPDRIFMLGHSMGGIEAPLLAAEKPPRGVAVFGTVVRNWLDYMQELDLYQDFLMNGADPVAEWQQSERNRELLRLFFIEKTSPRDIAALRPGLEPAMRDLFGWDGGENLYGRHYRFLQDLAGQPLIEAWSKTGSNVLSLYGESDMVAVFGTDQRMIADLVNYYRPGTARFVEVAGTMHGMDTVGDRSTVRTRRVEEGAEPQGDFNSEVSRILVEWVKDSMARPPVRLSTFPDSLAAKVEARAGQQ